MVPHLQAIHAMGFADNKRHRAASAMQHVSKKVTVVPTLASSAKSVRLAAATPLVNRERPVCPVQRIAVHVQTSAVTARAGRLKPANPVLLIVVIPTVAMAVVMEEKRVRIAPRTAVNVVMRGGPPAPASTNADSPVLLTDVFVTPPASHSMTAVMMHAHCATSVSYTHLTLPTTPYV